MDEERADLLSDQLEAINIGLLEFFESLVAQGVQVIHVDWRPPAAGDEEMINLLDEIL
jgi:FdrA protein